MQKFTDDYLARCRAMPADAIAKFLEDFRRLYGGQPESEGEPEGQQAPFQDERPRNQGPHHQPLPRQELRRQAPGRGPGDVPRR